MRAQAVNSRLTGGEMQTALTELSRRLALASGLAGACLVATVGGCTVRQPVSQPPLHAVDQPVGAGAAVREVTVQIPTYSYEHAKYIPRPIREHGPEMYPYPRIRHEQVAAKPTAREYNAVILENAWLEVTVLPELGGRIYRVRDKLLDADLFYVNPTFKPNPYCQQRWWIATGGVEFCFPDTEHSVNILERWRYSISRKPECAAVTVADTDKRRGLTECITISLPSDGACFDLTISLFNPHDVPKSFMYWTNAMVPATEHSQIVMPVRHVRIGWGAQGWPIHDGLDLSWLRNHACEGSYFAVGLDADFVGYYDHALDRGFVRAFPHTMARGIKLFTYGNTEEPFLQPIHYTDTGTRYAELMGGRTKDFGSYELLSPRQRITWTERWYPIHGTDGVAAASRDIAVSLRLRGGKFLLAAVSPKLRRDCRWQLSAGDDVVASGVLSLGPAQPSRTEHLLPAGRASDQLMLQIYDAEGQELIQCPIPETPASQPVDASTQPDRRSRTQRLAGDASRVRSLLRLLQRCLIDHCDPLASVVTALLRHGQYEASLPLLEQGLAGHSDDTIWLNDLGCCRQALGDTERAWQAFERVLALDPTDLYALAKADSVLTLLGRDAEADHYARRLRGLLEDHAHNRTLLGLAHWRRSEDACAHGMFAQAIRLEPDNMVAFSGAVLTASARGRGIVVPSVEQLTRRDHTQAIVYGDDASLALLREMVARWSHVGRYHYHLANAYLIRGERNRAAHHLAQATELDPPLALPHRLLAELLLYRYQPEDKQTALEHLRRAVELDPSQVEWRHFLVRHDEKLDAPARHEELVQLYAMDPSDAWVMYDLAVSCARNAGDFDRARSLLERIRNTLAYYRYEWGRRLIMRTEAASLELQGRLAESCVKWKKLLEGEQGSLAVRHALAELQLRLGNEQEARKVWRQTVQEWQDGASRPWRDPPELYVGLALLALGEAEEARPLLDQAVERFQEWIERWPDWPRPRYWLALAYHALGQNHQATESVRTYLQAEPADPMATLLLNKLRAGGGGEP